MKIVLIHIAAPTSINTSLDTNNSWTSHAAPHRVSGPASPHPTEAFPTNPAEIPLAIAVAIVFSTAGFYIYRLSGGSREHGAQNI